MVVLFNRFFPPQKSSLAGHGVVQLEQEDHEFKASLGSGASLRPAYIQK